MDCTKKIISWLYGECVNAQTYVLRIGELGQFVQFKKKIERILILVMFKERTGGIKG